jgi:hypothetical protein
LPVVQVRQYLLLILCTVSLWKTLSIIRALSILLEATISSAALTSGDHFPFDSFSLMLAVQGLLINSCAVTRK